MLKIMVTEASKPWLPGPSLIVVREHIKVSIVWL